MFRRVPLDDVMSSSFEFPYSFTQGTSNWWRWSDYTIVPDNRKFQVPLWLNGSPWNRKALWILKPRLLVYNGL